MAPLPAVAAELELVLANLWLGAGETVSPLHYDEYDNVLLVLRGRKELLLFPPSDLEHLYYAARLKVWSPTANTTNNNTNTNNTTNTTPRGSRCGRAPLSHTTAAQYSHSYEP